MELPLVYNLTHEISCLILSKSLCSPVHGKAAIMTVLKMFLLQIERIIPCQIMATAGLGTRERDICMMRVH